jgi:hypothetical protein
MSYVAVSKLCDERRADRMEAVLLAWLISQSSTLRLVLTATQNVSDETFPAVEAFKG